MECVMLYFDREKFNTCNFDGNIDFNICWLIGSGKGIRTAFVIRKNKLHYLKFPEIANKENEWFISNEIFVTF